MLALFSCPKEVSITPYLSKDQIAAAREMDLLTYLRRFEPEELVHIGGDTYATRTHDSLKISNGKWCWWSRNIGGTTALDYLTRVEGLSFLDAVQRILGELPHVPPKSEPTAPLSKTEFTLPPKHADNRRVFAYLRSRGIDAEIINHCIKHGQLYGVLFYPIINKVEKTGTVEIMAKARDAKQINRIFERMGYPAPVKEDTAAKKENARASSENSLKERGTGARASTEPAAEKVDARPSVRSRLMALQAAAERDGTAPTKDTVREAIQKAMPTRE